MQVKSQTTGGLLCRGMVQILGISSLTFSERFTYQISLDSIPSVRVTNHILSLPLQPLLMLSPQTDWSFTFLPTSKLKPKSTSFLDAWSLQPLLFRLIGALLCNIVVRSHTWPLKLKLNYPFSPSVAPSIQQAHVFRRLYRILQIQNISRISESYIGHSCSRALKSTEC